MASDPLVPDIAGFRDAQERLIDKLGQNVDFKLRRAPQYPPGTPLDRETGRPHDPTIKPLAGTDGFDIVTVRCAIVYKPIHVNVEDPTQTGWGGIRRGESMAVTMKVADYPAVEEADEAQVYGLNFRVTEIVPDGLTEVQRYIAFLEAR